MQHTQKLELARFMWIMPRVWCLLPCGKFIGVACFIQEFACDLFVACGHWVFVVFGVFGFAVPSWIICFLLIWPMLSEHQISWKLLFPCMVFGVFEVSVWQWYLGILGCFLIPFGSKNAVEKAHAETLWFQVQQKTMNLVRIKSWKSPDMGDLFLAA